MEIIEEHVTRKVDSLGRISIPKGIRDRMRINTGEEVEFFLGIEDGECYIMMKGFASNTRKERETAMKVLVQMGLDVPQELLDSVIE